MKTIPQVFTEEEFVHLLNTGEVPRWFSEQERKNLLSRTVFFRIGRRADHRVNVDFAASEYIDRQLILMSQLRDWRKRNDAVYVILDSAMRLGLLRQVNVGNRKFVSTERLERYLPNLLLSERPLLIAGISAP